MKKILTIIIIILVSSCSEKVIEPPENLIPKNKMIDILYDLAIINAAKSTNVKVLEEHGLDPMNYIYEKYAIDSLQFVRSDNYYASLPLEYEAIYTTLESRLKETREKAVESRKHSEEEQKKQREQLKKISQDTLP